MNLMPYVEKFETIIYGMGLLHQRKHVNDHLFKVFKELNFCIYLQRFLHISRLFISFL